MDTVERQVVDDWANVHALVQSVAQFKLLGSLDQSLLHSRGDTPLDDQTRGSGATLSARTEGCPNSRIYDQFNSIILSYSLRLYLLNSVSVN